MSIKQQDWPLSNRGVKDAARHREKIRESIQKNISNIIGDSSIITRKKGQIIKVPIQGLKSYRFVYRSSANGGKGIGQGEGGAGDIIGREPLDGEGQPGKAGDQPGVDYLETEIDIEELIGMMLKDLGLPNLRKKAIEEMAIPKGWKFDSIEKTGQISHLHKKRTVKEAIKRNASFVGELMRRTGKSQEDCEVAFQLAKGNIVEAEEILNSSVEVFKQKWMELFQGVKNKQILLSNDDLRFRTLDQDIEYQSNAVVLAMMDVSGSMTATKKYFARSFFFWLVEFLKTIYNNVQVRFISHTTEAKIVDEHEFFHKGESGGTYCHSAYDLAIKLIENEYNPSRWNIYPFHFSDGEDFDPYKTVQSVKKILSMGISMLGYGEIRADDYTNGELMGIFQEELDLEVEGFNEVYKDQDQIEVLTGGKLPFVGVVLKNKEDIYPALREFLKKERVFV